MTCGDMSGDDAKLNLCILISDLWRYPLLAPTADLTRLAPELLSAPGAVTAGAGAVENLRT